MSIVAWAVNRYSKAPERMEYARETAAFYIRADGRRDAKETSWCKLYSDHGEALGDIQRRIERDEQRRRADLVQKAAHDLLAEHQDWSQKFGAALMSVMQEDYGPITELAMSMPFDFHEGVSPTLRSAAIAKARGEA